MDCGHTCMPNRSEEVLPFLCYCRVRVDTVRALRQNSRRQKLFFFSCASLFSFSTCCSTGIGRIVCLIVCSISTMESRLELELTLSRVLSTPSSGDMVLLFALLGDGGAIAGRSQGFPVISVAVVVVVVIVVVTQAQAMPLFACSVGRGGVLSSCESGLL